MADAMKLNVTKHNILKQNFWNLLARGHFQQQRSGRGLRCDEAKLCLLFINVQLYAF